MLNSMIAIQNLKPESFHAVMYGGVAINTVRSQVFLLGEDDMSRFKRKNFLEPCNWCGGNATHRFKNGKHCCGDNVAKCPNVRKINSEKRKQRVGWHHTEETKEKIRKGNLGQKPSDEQCKAHSEYMLSLGENHPFKSPKFRKAQSKRTIKRNIENNPMNNPETVKKMSKSLRGENHPFYNIKRPEHSECMKGENNPNWRGGIAAEPYCPIWNDKKYKKSISERDNHTCQNPDCWKTCAHLPLIRHHIDYDKKNCHPWNLITLCASCHSRTNGSREYWTEFYQNIMTEKYGYSYD